MKLYNSLLEGNKEWVEKRLQQDPLYFEKLSQGQSPQFLWIVARIAGYRKEVTKHQFGDIFVHETCNMVVHSDMNG